MNNLLKLLKRVFSYFQYEVIKPLILTTPPKPGSLIEVRSLQQRIIYKFKSSRKLEDADETLQRAFRLIRMYYRGYFPHHTLVITQSYRSIKEQQKLYAKGRTKPGKIVTYVDGIKKKGKHNYYPSKAIDVAVKSGITNKITWDVEYYKPLVRLAKKVSKEVGKKITSGGSWKKLKDFPHLQV